MVSVKNVYETLRDLVNKDNQGFITPDEFNRFAPVAQMNIYNRLFDNLKNAQRNLKAGFDRGRDKGLIKRVEEDLSVFSASYTSTKTNSIFPIPSNFSRVISISTAGDILLGQSTRKPIEICYDEEKIERMLISNLSAPSETYPVALISNGIEVFPESINKIKLRYYKVPEAPLYSVLNNTSSVFDPTTSVDFQLPKHYSKEIILEIAEMAGMNLRDQNVIAYASGEAQQKQAEQSY